MKVTSCHWLVVCFALGALCFEVQQLVLAAEAITHQVQSTKHKVQTATDNGQLTTDFPHLPFVIYHLPSCSACKLNFYYFILRGPIPNRHCDDGWSVELMSTDA